MRLRPRPVGNNVLVVDVEPDALGRYRLGELAFGTGDGVDIDDNRIDEWRIIWRIAIGATNTRPVDETAGEFGDERQSPQDRIVKPCQRGKPDRARELVGVQVEGWEQELIGIAIVEVVAPRRLAAVGMSERPPEEVDVAGID